MRVWLTVLVLAFGLFLSSCRDRAEPQAAADGAEATTRTASGRALPTSDAAVARLVVPAIGIDQGVVDGGVDPITNSMIAPDGPFEIAYYRYSAQPGTGNAVFSGHVDFVNVGPAVFWNLRKLKEGDGVLVRLADGLELRYEVVFNAVYDVDDGPWDRLFARDAAPDAVTLYTCDGDFDRRSQTYSQRRVVRAVRVG